MKIGFIGAGKVGSSFGHYLKDRGLEVLGYSSKSKSSAIKAAEFTNTNFLELSELLNSCEYIFITTPDDFIAEVWSEIKPFQLQDKKIFHMSGSLSSKIFDDIETKGAFGYSLHPLFPFTNNNSYTSLGDAIFTIEGKFIAEIEGFLSISKINYYEIKQENKAKYHAAAVFASNYVVALAKISKTLLLECGLPDTEIDRAIFPLMTGALNNIKEKGIEKALTGPILRGDVGTIKLHREILKEYRDVYDELGMTALEIASENGNLSKSKIEEMKYALGGIIDEKDCGDL